MTVIEILALTFLIGIVAAGLGILAIIVLRVRDNRRNPDGWVSPEEVQATAERIYQINHPLEDEVLTREIRIDVTPRPVPEPAWHERPVDPDEPAPLFHAAGEFPILRIDPSFTRAWDRESLLARIRTEEARQAGVVR